MIYLASLTEETQYKLDGYSFIHTKEELDKLVAKNYESNRVYVQQDFRNKYFTIQGFEDYVRAVKSFNINIIIESDLEESISYDYLCEKISSCRNIDEIITLAVAYDKEFMDMLNFLISQRFTEKKEMLETSNQISRLQDNIDVLNTHIDDLKSSLAIEVQNKSLYQFKMLALIARINYQHNAGVDKDKLFHIDRNSFDKVIYIKEITRVQYVDTFLYYLQEILKTLYSMPCRSLVIESYYAGSKIPLYPDFVPHYDLKEHDVINGNILMLGMQPKLMTDILRNPSNISILIVLDRCGFEVPHLSGKNVEVLYTVSDLKDVPDGVPLGRCISYSEQSLFINYIRDFDRLDVNARMHEYSSMNIMKRIIELIEKH